MPLVPLVVKIRIKTQRKYKSKFELVFICNCFKLQHILHYFALIKFFFFFPFNLLSGIMFVCARLVAEAVQSYKYQLGDDLEKPLSSQCIITDGIRLSFINYQLNTLSFSGDEGIKNMAWISPGVFMYKKAMFEDLEKPVAEKTVKERKRFRRPVTLKDPAKHEIVLEEFNPDCFETFVKMIVNGYKAI